MVQRKDIKTEDIIHLYVNEKMIGKEIAAILDCSIPLVQQRLKQAGIKMRPSNERKTFSVPEKEVLRKLYWDDKLHPSQIGKIYGVCFSTIVRWMKDYEIPFRTKSESRIGKMNPIFRVGHSPETRNKMSKLFLEGRRKVSLTNVYGNPTEYKGVIYRSSWEAAVAYYLNSLNISHLYEANSFPYKDEAGIERVYTPDFYLPQGLGNDPNPLYLEIKGWFAKKDAWKIQQVKDKYVEVLVWGRKELLELGIINPAGKIIIGLDEIRKLDLLDKV